MVRQRGILDAAGLLTAYSDDLPSPDISERRQRVGHERFKIAQPVRGSTQDNDGNSSIGEVLLVRHVLIDSDEDVKASALGCFEEDAVFQARKFCKTSGLAIVALK
jgi:hypothetical protein